MGQFEPPRSPSGRLIMLGSGTSNGVPTAGKEYSDAFLSDARNHRTRASVVLEGPLGNLLIDASPELRIQLVREKVFDLESVLITHTHADHIMGLDDVRSFCLKYERAMTVYAWPEYQEDIRRVYPYAFKEFPKGIWVPRFDLVDVPEVIEVGGLNVVTMRVEHGPIPVVAVRVNDLAYVTDVSEIPEAAWEKLQGLDTLILDAVRYRPHPNHFHFEKSLEVAAELGAKVTYLTHLSDDYDHAEVDAELPGGVRLAYDGLRVEF